jgi:hypothetical protein
MIAGARILLRPMGGRAKSGKSAGVTDTRSAPQAFRCIGQIHSLAGAAVVKVVLQIGPLEQDVVTAAAIAMP